MATFSEMSLKCDRLKFLLYHNIKGYEQKYFKIREILRKYCEEALSEHPITVIKDQDAINKMKELSLDKIIRELKEYITITQIYNIKNEIVYYGIINDKKALFNFSFSSHIHFSDAMSLLYIKKVLNLNDDIVLATILLKENKIREYPKEGKLTKQNTPDKRDTIGSWDNIEKEMKKTFSEYKNNIIFAMQIPEGTFGECGICPYHNYKINYKEKEIICNG